MPHTIVEKILMKKSGQKNLKPGDFVIVEPDTVMSHDNTYAIIDKFNQTGKKKIWNKNKIVIIFDHCVPPKPKHVINHEIIEKFAKEQNLPYFLGAKEGVCHQVMIEKCFVLPGKLIVGADSHSTIYGAINALGIPINRTEMAGVWATGKLWLEVPETIKINLNGKLQKGVYSKDVILYLLGKLGAEGANYKSLEFHGSTIKNFSISDRLTLSNMAVELGAKCCLMNCDFKLENYIKFRTNKKYCAENADVDVEYFKELFVDVSTLTPQISCPHSPDNVKEIKEVKGIKIDKAYLGSCTNGRLEDLAIAAKILRGKKVKNELVVYPASYKVKEEARRLGLLKILESAGAKIKTASCGPCFGAVGETLNDEEVCISSGNRNFKGRMGSPNSEIYLASPATVAASCLEGKIADPRCYL